MSDEAIEMMAVNAKWKKKFAIISKERSGAKLSTWEKLQTQRSLIGFIFGPLYYFHLGMRQKAAVLITTAIVVCFIGDALESYFGHSLPKRIDILLPLFVPIYCAVFVAEDFYIFKVKKVVMWGPTGWSAKPLYTIIACVSAIVVAVFIRASFDTPSDIYADVSGIWKTDDDEIIKINLDDNTKVIQVGSNSYNCAERNAEPQSSIVVLQCSAKNGRSFPMTLRQNWDNKHAQFTLGLTINDMQEFNLGYVRPN